MNFKKAIQDSDRAVSPVIGVILMVAITVILAAVIGTFVLGLGDSLGDTQPSAQLDISNDATTNNITIEHTGGNELRLADFDIQVRNGSSVADSGTLSELVNEDTSTIGVGETVTVEYTNNGEDTDNIRIIHTPSESIFSDRTVVIENFDEFGTA